MVIGGRVDFMVYEYGTGQSRTQGEGFRVEIYRV